MAAQAAAIILAFSQEACLGRARQGRYAIFMMLCFSQMLFTCMAQMLMSCHVRIVFTVCMRIWWRQCLMKACAHQLCLASAGDKNLEKMPGRHIEWFEHDQWLLNVQQLASDNDMAPLGTCLVYGDDLSAIEVATAGLVNMTGCYPIRIGGVVGGHWQEKYNHAGTSRPGRDLHCEETSDLILELHALANADLFAGRYSSNIPVLVHVMRVHLFEKSAETARDVLNEIDWHHDWTIRSGIAQR